VNVPMTAPHAEAAPGSTRIGVPRCRGRGIEAARCREAFADRGLSLDDTTTESPRMSKIHVTRSHSIGLEGAREEVERIAQRVQEEFGADYAWDGDTLHFSRSGVHGRITVTEDSLDLTIKLGLLLTAMKGQIEERIVQKIDQRLARHQAGDSAA
jgi:putative polyhydroxyalkanoate system protein